MKKNKLRENWFSVICITLFYDLFMHTNPTENFCLNQQWLNKRLSAVGKLRMNKVLKIWLPIKFIIVGIIAANLIINNCSSNFYTTIFILLDIIIVSLLIWANR